MTEKDAWNSTELIAHYHRTADVTIPDRKKILSKIAELASAFVPRRPEVLDLGCGSGDVIAEIVRLRPDAPVCGVDLSEGMIKLARNRFQSENVRILTHDLNNGIPEDLVARKFDAVTSCFALHHIDFGKRVGLYTQIRQVLRDGGLFINGDVFTGESPEITEWETDNLMRWIMEQAKQVLGVERTFDQVKQRQRELTEMQGDKPGTLRAMQDDLRAAGFRYVDCVWMEYHHGIVVATNG